MLMRVSETLQTAAFAAALTMQACVGANAAPRSGPVPANTADPQRLQELEALYEARADSALMRFTEADVHFMTGMIAHHAQALVMSRLAPTHGASASVRTLTARIINSQNDEIETMSAWLEARGQPVPQIRIEGTELSIEGVSHEMTMMPGMLTDEQIRELDQARGPEYDRVFLTYMIQHHSGAVQMVHDLFATDGAALDDSVFKIASDIQADQTTEIRRMELMLEALPRADGPR
jgi:uncharacterized protein (DUF305 family)